MVLRISPLLSPEEKRGHSFSTRNVPLGLLSGVAQLTKWALIFSPNSRAPSVTTRPRGATALSCELKSS